MAAASAGCSGEASGSRDDIKTQFTTREGMYKLITLSDCVRPSRVPQNGPTNVPVKLSFVSLGDRNTDDDRICFNIGKELYFFQYDAVGKVLDLTRPLDKRVYRGTAPTCHDFSAASASLERVLLVVGFSAGQIQLIDPVSKELSKLYNEERMLDKAKVTCIRWVPGSTRLFVAAYASGQLYVYDVELCCTSTVSSSGALAHYQVVARGDAFTVCACRAKMLCNPLQRWTVGTGAVNEFAFSPCGRYIAIVGADGYMRVFLYSTVELVGVMRSYFGGLLCVAWSPDGRYIATGGEDDLVTLWSLAERRVVCRGRGHRSWVSGVAFDPFAASSGSDFLDFGGSDDDFCRPSELQQPKNDQSPPPVVDGTDGSPCSVQSSEDAVQSYRLGSIGHDAMLCLWDVTDDVLRRPLCRARTGTMASRSDADVGVGQNGIGNTVESAGSETANCAKASVNCVITPTTGVVQKFATLALGDRPGKDKQQRRSASGVTSDHRWYFSLASRSSDSKIQLLKAAAAATSSACTRSPIVDDAVRLLGSPVCPRLSEAPVLVPLVGKRIAHERLTALIFREDCVVATCQEGMIYTFARPGKTVLVNQSLSGTQLNMNNTAL